MQSLAEKEHFDQSFNPSEAKDEDLKALGIEKSSFAIKYYFVPAAAFPYAETPAKEKQAK